ncbi:MAG: neutral/alkaline non-lysosomal ceramidase N-terminal domain-containing protein [Dehalococcoidia bacterium]|nr:neutral/alkaline non-lysosomal ceramidase N-terminal domain-containing protein [Dehalococcoidia bacterium]
MPLLAGAATADITPPVGGLMDGYGSRREGSQGVHDPLMASALVLDDSHERCAIVSCDLLGMHEWVTGEVRRRVGKATGIPPHNILVCATHNHAGPIGLRGGMFSRLDEALASSLAGKLTDAAVAAWEQRRPAALKVSQATVDTVSMNRRDPDWPIDPALRVVLVDGEEGPIASLLNFACHGTVLSGANLQLSGEFPGAACRLLQRETGAPAVYLNGACGNVNPVWIRQDFESVERVGQIIGGQALRLIGELRTAGPGQRAHNIRWDEFPEKPAPGRLVQPRLRVARAEVELPLREFAPDAEYAARSSELETRAAALAPASGGRRQVMAQLTRLQNERWAAAWARMQPDRRSQRAEVQALGLGDGLAVLALPGEFFAETAAAIRAACAAPAGGQGIQDLLVACYANDYIGYVIPAEAYEQGGYESGITFCGPEAEGIIVHTSLSLLKEVPNGD